MLCNRVCVGTGHEKPLNNVVIAPCRRQVKRRLTVSIASINHCFGLHQKADQLILAANCRNVKWRFTATVKSVDIRAGSDKRFPDGAVAGDMQWRPALVVTYVRIGSGFDE